MIREVEKNALALFQAWFSELPVHKASGGPAKGTISAALVVLERLKSDFALDLEAHRAPGGSQIKGASGLAVKKILERYGETRPFAKEGGRTNRGGPGDVKKMLDTIKKANLGSLPPEKRHEIVDHLQRFLVDKVREFHNRERIKLVFDLSKSTWQMIQGLLTLARETGKEGPVAQHLVGAKLSLRLPDTEVSNESFSTADDQLGRPGDFYINDTAFHVTVAPMVGVYEKCKRNLEDGLRVYLLVPDRLLAAARQNVDLIVPSGVAVESIESFVSQNIEELSYFSKSKLVPGFRRLLDTYNSRVGSAEIDRSLLIEIPKNL